MTDATAYRAAELEERARVVAALAEPYLRHGRLLPLHLECEMRAITSALREMRERVA